MNAGVFFFAFTIFASALVVHLVLLWEWKYPVFGVCVDQGMNNGMHQPGFWNGFLFSQQKHTTVSGLIRSLFIFEIFARWFLPIRSSWDEGTTNWITMSIQANNL